MSSLPNGWLTRDSRRLPAVRASGWEEEQVLPLGWEERLHLPHGWIGSRSTGWEEGRGLPKGWRARDCEWGEEHDLPHGWLGRHILQPQNKKHNKTAKEPKKQNAGARNRVALGDRLKLDMGMTKPEHKVWTMFTKRPHVVYSPCHSFIVSLVHHVINSPSWSMPSINHALHSYCHPSTIPSNHHVIHSPYHPYSMSSIQHVIRAP